jgi:hypothetical protein
MEVGGDGSDGRRRGNSGRRGETAGGMRPRPAREGGSPASGLRLVSAPGCTVEVGRPKSAFSLFWVFFQIVLNWFVLTNYGKGTFRVPKISKLGMSVDKFKWDKFPFGPNSKSLMILNYKFQEQIQFESCLNLKRVHPFWEKFHNFTTNLSWHHLWYCKFRLTHLYCKLEVTLQVVIRS